jgi:hypothetical protein
MKSYRRLSIDASGKSLLYLGKWLQKRRFLEIDKPETRIVIFPRKLGGAMNCYFAGMMYERYCTKFLYFMPIIQLI